jgi:hypothetical protein
MPLLTQKEYARRKGVTPQYVNKLARQGKIRLVGKKVDPKQADAALKAFRRAGRVIPALRRAKQKAAKPAARPKAPLAAMPEPRNSATRSLTAARAEREHYQAQMAKLDYEKAFGSLLPRDQVLEAERRKNANIRAKFRQLARSLAPRVSRVSSPAEVEYLLLSEIDLVLGQLAMNPLGIEEPPAPPPEPIASPLPVIEPAAPIANGANA